MQSDQRGARQTAYRVLVATSLEMLAKDKGDLWDSGKVVSDQSWKGSDGPIYWDQLRMGVMYDARREQPGWNTPTFDDSKWQQAIIREGAKGKLAAQVCGLNRSR